MHTEQKEEAGAMYYTTMEMIAGMYDRYGRQYAFR